MRVTVLGSGQDGGLPQAGAHHPNDEMARRGEIPERTGPSLLVEDASLRLICDVSPDFRLQWWKRSEAPDAIALTHAHIGHYVGLAHFGKETMAAHQVPVHASPRMLDFLSHQAPWNALFEGAHLRPAQNSTWAGHTIDLISVPHRSEYTDTMAVSVAGRVLWLPDIDSWERWPEAEHVIAAHELVFLDATFWSGDEIPDRNLADIPHPLVPETLERFHHLDNRRVLVHLNHTNPLCDPTSPEHATVVDAGFEVATDGLTMDLS
ncbi:MAG: MBL fold metallo-hydrolase [Acidimicrobiia bacterium]